jgi:hypothetical protein
MLAKKTPTLAALLAAGAAIRLLIAARYIHSSYDIDSFRIVDATLRSHPGLLYATHRWPYPGAFLPWVLVAGWLGRHTAVDISVWLKLPAIAADVAIAWLVHAFLGLRRASERRRLAGAACIALGPSLIAISGYEGQIDAVAIAFAVAAVYCWARLGRGPRRELVCSLLIGAGAAVKTVPILLLLAFLPLVADWRARARFAAVALAVPFVSVLPWLLTHPHTLKALDYAGLPGAGALSLAVQPSLAEAVLVAGSGVRYSALTLHLQDVRTLLLAVPLALLALMLLRRRPAPERAATLVWLVVYVFLANFFFQYVVWGLPFMVMAGLVWETAAVQLALLVPTLLWIGRPWHNEVVVWLYVLPMLGAWAAAAAGTLLLGRRWAGRVDRPLRGV